MAGAGIKTIVIMLSVFLCYSVPVRAEVTDFMDYGLLDLTEMQEGMEKMFPGSGVDLNKAMSFLFKGEIMEAFKSLWNDISGSIQGEFEGIRELLISIIVIGLLSALFKSLGEMFEGQQVSQVGFYIIFLFMMALLTRAFLYTASIASDTVENIVLFIRLFIPTYFIAMGTAVGVTTATVSYQFVLVIIYGVETFLLSALMPLIYSYVILSMANGLWIEEKLTLLLDLLKKAISFALKLSMGVITGVSLIQSIIAPAIDNIKASGIQKAISLIPGIGNFAEGVAEMVVGSAVLIKNSIGVLLLILLLLVCAVPVMKLLLVALIIKGGAALIGMVSEKRIADCVNRVGDSSFLLLQTVLTAVTFFLIVIAVAAYTTR